MFQSNLRLWWDRLGVKDELEMIFVKQILHWAMDRVLYWFPTPTIPTPRCWLCVAIAAPPTMVSGRVRKLTCMRVETRTMNCVLLRWKPYKNLSDFVKLKKNLIQHIPGTSLDYPSTHRLSLKTFLDQLFFKGFQQGWEFAHLISERIARFLSKNERMSEFLALVSRLVLFNCILFLS